MSRYIDASKISLTTETALDPTDLEVYVPLVAVRAAIAQTPTEDVQKIRHGEWKRTSPTTPKSYRRICSVCGMVGHMIGEEYPYCPNCGAKMDGGGKDSEN